MAPLPHGFSDETPIENILQSYCNIYPYHRRLYHILALMAADCCEQRTRVSGVHGQYIPYLIKCRYDYILNRVLVYTGLSKTEKEKATLFYNRLVDDILTGMRDEDKIVRRKF